MVMLLIPKSVTKNALFTLSVTTQIQRMLYENVIIVTRERLKNKPMFVEPKTTRPKRRKKPMKLQNSGLQAKLLMLPE